MALLLLVGYMGEGDAIGRRISDQDFDAVRADYVVGIGDAVGGRAADVAEGSGVRGPRLAVESEGVLEVRPHGIPGTYPPRLPTIWEEVIDVPPPAAPAAPVDGWTEGWATHYGVSYNGQTMGCPGAGVYSSDNPTILAVSPARYSQWPCGTAVEVCGPGGCAVFVRSDACPGCSANVLDLSESGNRLVCGAPEHTCRVKFRRLP